MWSGENYVLICNPNMKTDATVERTMAAAAEKPFMMLSVYFTTTDVYRPPTLASTGSTKEVTAKIPSRKAKIPTDSSCSAVLTHYEAHHGRVAEEETVLQDLLAIVYVNTNQCDHNTGDVHLDVSHPQRRVRALQHLLKVHALNHKSTHNSLLQSQYSNIYNRPLK